MIKSHLAGEAIRLFRSRANDRTVGRDPMDVTLLAFGAGLFAAAGVYAILLVTLATDRRLWPPGEKSWAYYLHWTLVGVFDVSLVVVAVREWGAWALPRPAALLVGGLGAAFGTVVFAWGAGWMRSDETMGVTGELYTDGPYAYTRNPQYVGMIVGVVGFAVLVDSLLVAVLAAVHVGWVLLLPRAEEPHLREEFGAEYEQYAARVPRFVGTETIRRLVQKRST